MKHSSRDPVTDGERDAAESAWTRIRARLRPWNQAERIVEFRFSLTDAWSRSLFIALLRRYGLRPYRYRGQRRTTVMVKVTQTFVDETLWPEFQQFQAVLHDHFHTITRIPAERREPELSPVSSGFHTGSLGKPLIGASVLAVSTHQNPSFFAWQTAQRRIIA